ncbi:MAG: hypothetical protein Ct9H300mP12_08720 [Acidimicrobiales bacterium]|nr:MAG: hypothetical protein Ct9H300mP12_08720 [Acidimicrobiales bacterium]
MPFRRCAHGSSGSFGFPRILRSAGYTAARLHGCPATTAARPKKRSAPLPTTSAMEASARSVSVPGEEIQIRSLNAISGDVAFLGSPTSVASSLGIADYGPIGGHDVTIGTGPETCAALMVARRPPRQTSPTSRSWCDRYQLFGCGDCCEPLVSEAGMVMISGSNTSPALTSDLAGTAGPNYHAGYYRTAKRPVPGCGGGELRPRRPRVGTAAAIHDGDPYTQGPAQAFANAFEAGGGAITGFTAVNKGDTDMVPVLTEVAAGGPEFLFFPIFQPEGTSSSSRRPRSPAWQHDDDGCRGC